MKKIIYILLLSWSIVTFAQSNVKVIENQFLDYNQLIVKKKKDIDDSFGGIYY